MMFNNRRQTRDRVVLQKIKDIVKDDYLYINDYSISLFKEIDIKTKIEDILKYANNGYYFIENVAPKCFEKDAHKIILFCWSKTYPADSFFNISLDNYDLENEEEFKGYSHEKIIMRIYNRRGCYE